MSAEVKKEILLEIAHVLFTDIVGYSKLPINEQRALIERLNEIVRGTDEFQAAQAAGRLIKIPTGDGITLVFYQSPEAPVECALEISRALKKHPELQLRMGIHSGPVSGVIDVTGKANVAGAGINMAQRVMDCGDAGHILLSKHVAEDLEQYPHWQPYLRELGECEVKHGMRISVVNLYTEELGNPAVPEKLKAARLAAAAKRKRIAFRRLSLGVLSLLVAVVAIGFLFLRYAPRFAPRALTVPEKSIAVLPFQNLSKEEANAFFADGVMDEILTDLARIADLKVISRTSVMHYKSGVARNLREIGQQLGVANVVEGSVQRSGKRVRVNAQLVDTRTDRHLWGQTYDRDLADVFAIQSEIAKTIADQLQAKLSPTEKSAIERPPTSDITAFDLYTRAKDLILTSRLLVSADKGDFLHAIELLNQAVARDPSFFDAYCQLATAHGLLYLLGLDRTPARLALAEAAVDTAARLRPDAGETHLARAQILYQGHLDYNGALAELELARQTLPNDSRVYQLMGFIQRRQKGRYEESTRTLEHAIDLDPRNVVTLSQIASFNYRRLGRHADAKATWDRSLAIRPDDTTAQVNRAIVDFDWKADTRPLHQTIESIRATNPAALQSIASGWLLCALAERDAAAAKNALAAVGDKPIILGNENVFFSRSFAEGVIARMTHDDGKAPAAFTAARAEQEKIIQADPGYGSAVCVLGLIDAGLGRKDEAIREGRRAVELLPVEKDLPSGMDMIKYLAMIAAWVGDKNLACEQLGVAIHGPSGLTYGEMKLLPLWDPLRGDPRFEKLVEEAKLPLALRASESGARSAVNLAPAPEKSIAVLPFENRSRDPDNAYFAEGVQDEILTRLSKIADLKVISRTSTQHYTSAPENLPEIARQLGVAHVLEGSVQKSGDAVRVNVQLIKAANDSHLWADTFDRKLTDTFLVESEVAKAIADQLRAKLTGEEEQLITAKPTDNVEAYDAYLRGLALATSADSLTLGRTADFFAEAARLDPAFTLAWARLSSTQSQIYYILDHLPSRGDAAKFALDKALGLNGNLDEVLLAGGYYNYWVRRDFESAAAAFRQVLSRMPNNPEALFALSLIERRQGKWSESLTHQNLAVQLDPQNAYRLGQLVLTHFALKDFAAARSIEERVLKIRDDAEPRAGLARQYLAQGNVEQAEAAIREIAPTPDNSYIFEIQVRLALITRRFADAIRVLEAAVAHPSPGSGFRLGEYQYLLGFSQDLAGNVAAARENYESAKVKLEESRRADPENPDPAMYLGFVYAGLGDKAGALRAVNDAITLLPVSADAFQGSVYEEARARIQARVGEADSAIAEIRRLLDVSYLGPEQIALTPAMLRLDPAWDPIRNNPRFQELASSAPK